MDKNPDWFDELTPEQQKDVMEGLTDADNGEIITHIEAVEIFEKYGLK
jgi:predicted transcriptional regulator